MSATKGASFTQPKDLFYSLLKKHRIGHAYLFEGPNGTGKKELARWTAAAVLCLEQPEEEGPCGECINCRRILTGQHPDVVEVEPDGRSIKVDQIRFLKTEFTKSGVESVRKFFIIDQADKMTPGAANSLLKFLEEPEGKVTAFLLTTAKNRLLPTILSRCQIVSFHAKEANERVEELVEAGIPRSRAALFAHLTNDLKQAAEWNEEEWYQTVPALIWRWFVLLNRKDYQAFVFVQSDLMPVLKERGNQIVFLDILLLLYRELLSCHYRGAARGIFPDQETDLKKAAAKRSGSEIADDLMRILEARKKLESNVPIQGLLEQLSLLMIEENNS